MGGRLSVPRAPDGANEKSIAMRPPRGRNYPINARTLMAPAAAATMAVLLFLYARTSIRAAKLNAQRHREADGGQIDWRNQSRRLHGQEERLQESTLREAFVEQIKGVKGPVNESGKGAAAVRMQGAVEGGAAAVGGRAEGGKLLEEAKVRRRLGDGRDA